MSENAITIPTTADDARRSGPDKEVEPSMADRVSGTKDATGMPCVGEEIPRIIDISSSLKKIAQMQDDPSTGAWSGGSASEKNLTSKITKLEAVVDILQEMITALPDQVMAQVTCMEIRLKARMDEMLKILAPRSSHTQKIEPSNSFKTPCRGDKGTPLGQSDRDCLTRDLLMEVSGEGGSRVVTRKRQLRRPKTPRNVGSYANDKPESCIVV